LFHQAFCHKCYEQSCYAPAPNRRGHSAMMLSYVCLMSVCRVHRASVENRDAQEDQNWHRGIASIRDSDTTFKVNVTRPLCSPPCWRVRRLQRWAWERVGRGKLLPRCRLLGGARRFIAHGEERGGGSRPPTACHSVFYLRKFFIYSLRRPNILSSFFVF